MPISIAHLRACGLSAEKILEIVEEADAERREKERIKKRNQRARPQDGGDKRDNGGHKSGPKREPRQFEYPAAFETFWQHYPLHIAKGGAHKAWERVIKGGQVTNDELIAGADRYTADPNRDPSYTKHGATWLNAGCHSDGPLPPRGGNGHGKRDRSIRAAFDDIFADFERQDEVGNVPRQVDLRIVPGRRSE